MEYKFINIHQRTETSSLMNCIIDRYKFINIHQRTETKLRPYRYAYKYKFINIHQRTETNNSSSACAHQYKFINIHQRTETECVVDPRAMFVQIYQYPSENRNYRENRAVGQDVQIYQYPSENRNRNILCFIAVSTFKNHIHYNSMISRLSR